MHPEAGGGNVVLRPDELAVSHVEMRRDELDGAETLQDHHPGFLRASELDAGVLDALQAGRELRHRLSVLRQGVAVAERSGPHADVVMAVSTFNEIVSLASSDFPHRLKNLLTDIGYRLAILPRRAVGIPGAVEVVHEQLGTIEELERLLDEAIVFLVARHVCDSRERVEAVERLLDAVLVGSKEAPVELLVVIGEVDQRAVVSPAGAIVAAVAQSSLEDELSFAFEHVAIPTAGFEFRAVALDDESAVSRFVDRPDEREANKAVLSTIELVPVQVGDMVARKQFFRGFAETAFMRLHRTKKSFHHW